MKILVTGCSRGVGLEICRVLLEQGNIIYGVARSHTDEFSSLEDAFPGKVNFKSIDLSNPEYAWKTIFKEYLRKIAIDGFVSNAAAAYDDIVTNVNLDRLEKMYAINVFTPIMLTKYAIRNMLLYKTHGSIVHISSVSVHTGYKGLAMYASTKGAIEAFSKNPAREWGALGIRSNTIVPGFMETKMSSTLTDDQRERIYKRTSLKAATDIRSVAETVAFLLSDKAKSITGENIHVDNGTI